MKVMIDTNILISAVYNRNSLPAKVVNIACEKHELILCDHIISECYDVLNRKFPQHIPVMCVLYTQFIMFINVSATR